MISGGVPIHNDSNSYIFAPWDLSLISPAMPGVMIACTVTQIYTGKRTNTLLFSFVFAHFSCASKMIYDFDSVLGFFLPFSQMKTVKPYLDNSRKSQHSPTASTPITVTVSHNDLGTIANNF